MREFFAGLKKKPCDDVDMATATVLEHWNDLVADYWSLIINLVNHNFGSSPNDLNVQHNLKSCSLHLQNIASHVSSISDLNKIG